METAPDQSPLSGKLLATLQRKTFDYFLNEVNPANGLIADRTGNNAPASIAAVGLAFSAYPVGIADGFLSQKTGLRENAGDLALLLSKQGREPDATGTGGRVWKCELSTVDTALLLAGALTTGSFLAKTTRRSRRSAPCRTRFTDAPTGTGRKTAAPPSRMAGLPSVASCTTAGKATTRR